MQYHAGWVSMCMLVAGMSSKFLHSENLKSKSAIVWLHLSWSYQAYVCRCY